MSYGDRQFKSTPLSTAVEAVFGEEADTFTVTPIDDGFELRFGAMYEYPYIDATRLMQLVDLFGTKRIDVDSYAESGCESCDWGSDYGHTIQIRGATNLVDEMKAMVVS